MKIVATPLRAGLSAQTHESFELLVRVQATPEDCEGRHDTPLNLALVIDRSGSMSGGKLDEAKRCVAKLIERLTEGDRVAIVDYHDTAETRLPLTTAPQARELVNAVLAAMRTGGQTALHGGWLQGADLLAASANEDCISRVVLLSDGNANVGASTADFICPQVQSLAAAGVTTTTVGLGLDFNEDLMTSMARSGQGSSLYGERLEDLEEAFDSELSLMKAIAFRKVRLVIDNDQALGIEVINGYAREDDGYQLPSIACGSEAWALLRMPMAKALNLLRQSGQLGLRVTAVDAQGNPVHESIEIQLPEDLPLHDYEALLPDALVARRSVELRSAEIQLAARQSARMGNWAAVERAIRELQELAKDHEWIAASIPFLQKLVRERDEATFSKEMYHKSMSMRSRLAPTDEESSFSVREEIDKAEFLRRKIAQGRKSDYGQ